MLRWAIPAYRLPRNILDKEIDDIRSLGVEIKCNTRVGKNISFNKVSKEFDIVYLAPGAHKSQKMGVDGENTAVSMAAWNSCEISTPMKRPG